MNTDTTTGATVQAAGANKRGYTARCEGCDWTGKVRVNGWKGGMTEAGKDATHHNTTYRTHAPIEAW